jgi:osmotically-inducible protein OsmY
MTDEEVRRAVLEQFKWDARIGANELAVAVQDGVVTLLGTVDSLWKKWDAEEIALRVKGVKTVANELRVNLPDGARRSDEAVAYAVRQALGSAHNVPDSVKAIVSDGLVTLTGEVEWNYQKTAASERVRGLVGVKDIVNAIEVIPRGKAEGLRWRIELALLRMAETHAKKIQVDVREDGCVVLRGSVHSWYEKQEATREAWLAPGVREVVDELKIES